jgi:DNA-binding NarL/FixJ family response regulator
MGTPRLCSGPRPKNLEVTVKITDRELRILELLVAGLGCLEIGREIGVCKTRVIQHYQILKMKAGVGNIRQLIVWALRKGVVS